jgi:DNA-binding CsgD family transcriptional regulator
MRTRDAALIRKLCSLGLPSQTLVQTLLPALRQVIPAHSAGVFWVDGKGEMTGLYAERLLPPETMATYYDAHYRSGLAGFAAAFRARAEGRSPVSAHSFSPVEQSSAYFRDVLKPLDAFHVLYGILRDGGRAFAQISLYRGARDAPFQRQDEDALASVIAYLGRGLSQAPSRDFRSDEAIVVEEGLGIVSDRGAVLCGSASWNRLVRLAALERLSPDRARIENAAIRDFLKDCVATLQRPDGTIVERGLERQTVWGRFCMRAFDLEPVDGGLRSTGLLIRREEPRTLALLRGAGNSGLAPQQREVALLLAQGKTNPQISEALGLRLNTTSYHVKQVYAKLEINDRNAVADRLLTLASGEISMRQSSDSTAKDARGSR